MAAISTTSLPPYALERSAALQAVTQACRLVRRVQASLITQETLNKRDRSPVTVADYAAQALIVHHLTTHPDFPAYPFIAEESSGELRREGQDEMRARLLEHVRSAVPSITNEEALLDLIDRGGSGNTKTEERKSPSGLWWTLDPIDGTLGFLRREQYAIALALMQDNQPVLGILGCPALPHNIADTESAVGCVLVAVKGQGCYMRSVDAEEEVAVETQVSSAASATEGAKANFTESVEAAHSAHDVSQRIAERLGVSAAPVRMDSQCKYAIVARGEASIYLRLTRKDYVENIWDHAAGVLIAEEAGGRVTDLEGKPLDWSYGPKLVKNVGVVATGNPTLHEVVLDAIRATLKEEPSATKL